MLPLLLGSAFVAGLGGILYSLLPANYQETETVGLVYRGIEITTIFIQHYALVMPALLRAQTLYPNAYIFRVVTVYDGGWKATLRMRIVEDMRMIVVETGWCESKMQALTELKNKLE